jgi:hypothetical protein
MAMKQEVKSLKIGKPFYSVHSHTSHSCASPQLLAPFFPWNSNTYKKYNAPYHSGMNFALIDKQEAGMPEVSPGLATKII